MSNAITATGEKPLTPAMLRELSVRSDWQGLVRAASHYGVIVVVGALIWLVSQRLLAESPMRSSAWGRLVAISIPGGQPPGDLRASVQRAAPFDCHESAIISFAVDQTVAATEGGCYDPSAPLPRKTNMKSILRSFELTSPLRVRSAAISCRLSSAYSPTTAALSKYSDSINSRVARAAAQDSGLPPYVLPCAPRGQVATYGQLSALLGRRLSPVGIGWALRAAPDGLPWHRVVNARGGASTDAESPGLQRATSPRSSRWI